MKINIDGALAKYTLATGKRMTRKGLADVVLPGAGESTKHAAIKNMADGTAKRIDPSLLVRICKVLRVDPNFLFVWEPENADHYIPSRRIANYLGESDENV